MEYGKLKRDDDCHWYLIPEDMEEEFDDGLEECRYMDIEDDEDVEYIFNKTFSEYRINSPYTLRIPMKGVVI